MPYTVCVRMDLIYEGITTGSVNLMKITLSRQNGPDLRRDYDQAVRRINYFTRRQNGPDLRRDYDEVSILIAPIVVVRMDLIYEGITTITI